MEKYKSKHHRLTALNRSNHFKKKLNITNQVKLNLDTIDLSESNDPI